MATLFSNCNLFDAETAKMQDNAWLLVDDQGLIQASGTGPAPAAEQTVDLHGQYIVPGLINAHTHITMDPMNNRTAFVSETEATVNALKNLQTLLKNGVTTIRDCGAFSGADVKLMKLMQQGKVLGPEIVPSGRPMSITGGHGDFPEGEDGDTIWGHLTNSASDMRQAVREEFKHGAKNIKVMATGGVMSPTDRVDDTELSAEELNTAVEEAHSKHMTVASHAQGNRGIQLSIEAGVDSIEHGIFIDEQQAAYMKDHNICLVPTLNAPQCIADAPEGVLPDYMRNKNAEIKELFFNNVGMAIKHGVRVVVGTDAGTPFNRFDNGTTTEMKLLVEVGATPLQALLGATKYAAELLQVDEHCGTLTKGKQANFLVLSANPLVDVAALEQVDKQVYQAGKLIK
ncbi:amidohydrolase family protein [Lactobacillus sp. ESL0684]|uniref:metal-dependent hydrolase family protein n=1 Tax=unclassified Lactobacillus TaxID=2620435 RepID=UPI0023F7AE03|nr:MULTISPECIES: amidohydrolase family protein [unclassified Lactobacillus]WEV40303.1 amidohydrolase family protein [Lactobacillus sp. ESL0681]WEV43181.1 amidohydrolase family protein [Lactobacillus sp. ESL0684]